MSIKEVLNNSLQTETSDIADGAGLYVGTNPPRELNIAMAISGGRTTNIAEALDIHYGNTEPSFTISKAIAAGAGTDDPTKSIEDVMSEMIDKDEYYTVKFDAGDYGIFELEFTDPETGNRSLVDQKRVISFKIPKETGVFPSAYEEASRRPDLTLSDYKYWILTGTDSLMRLDYYTTDVETASVASFPYTLTDDITFYATYKPDK